ncbi:MAG: STAS domain-containing protein [SAR324 cluster bacterium]|nr:STAS domain-containing protein [SAR324 cluster bacterium]
MKISHRHENQICIVSLEGGLIQKEVGDLKNYMLPLLEDKHTKTLVLNMKRIKDIDSAGIGMLVSIYKNIQKRQQEGPDESQLVMVLCGLNQKCRKIFSMVQIDKIMKIYETEEEVLADQGSTL